MCAVGFGDSTKDTRTVQPMPTGNRERASKKLFQSAQDRNDRRHTNIEYKYCNVLFSKQSYEFPSIMYRINRILSAILPRKCDVLFDLNLLFAILYIFMWVHMYIDHEHATDPGSKVYDSDLKRFSFLATRGAPKPR